MLTIELSFSSCQSHMLLNAPALW